MTRAGAALGIALIVAGLLGGREPARAQAPTVWTQWSTATAGSPGAAAGSLGGTAVTYSGEVLSPGTVIDGSAKNWSPETSFIGGTVTSSPSTLGDIIAERGSYTGTNTLSFSPPLRNPIIAVWSLGNRTQVAHMTFSATPEFEAGGPSAEYGGGAITVAGHVVTGQEGNGVVQFTGTFGAISWTDTAEYYYGFTVGAAGGLQPVYGFPGGWRGAAPQAALVMAPSGALFGTTFAGGGVGEGTVFELSPPAAGGGTWTESVLHSFTGRAGGGEPRAGLVLDAAGALYGTTLGGGAKGAGIVFRLAPPGAGATLWTEAVLHSFDGDRGGGAPAAGLLADSAGALYGTTLLGGAGRKGVVFKLTPPAAGRTAWTETVLHGFTGGADGGTPQASPIMDASGALYGTTRGGGAAGNWGVVYQLTPPAAGHTAWTETVLHSFTGGADGGNPGAGLIADASGTLYGTTRAGGAQGRGVVFALAPPAAGQSGWTATVLHSFAGGVDGAQPEAALLMDAAGALYGTTYAGGPQGDGVLYRLTPAATGTGWTETILHGFAGGPDGSHPLAALIADQAGTLYGTADEDGAGGQGVVFELAP